MDGKSYENILVYDVSYKTLIGAKPLGIIFDNVDGFIRVNIETKYLILSGLEDRILLMIGLDILYD